MVDQLIESMDVRVESETRRGPRFHRGFDLQSLVNAAEVVVRNR